MTLQYQPLSDRCIPPEQATPESVGYDLFTPIDFRIKPKACKVIFLDYALGIPEGNYGRIVSKLSSALDHNIDVKAGVVNRGYQGNIEVILKNNSEVPFWRKLWEPIAQLILEKAHMPLVERVDTLHPTEHGSRGFGQQTAMTYGIPATAPGKLPKPTYH